MNSSQTNQMLLQAVARLDALALGTAVGLVAGVGFWLATAVLLMKGGADVGKNLALLGQYFPGYRVTWTGAWIGLGYGCATGFLVGWLLATVRNFVVAFYLQIARAKAAARAARGFFDNV